MQKKTCGPAWPPAGAKGKQKRGSCKMKQNAAARLLQYTGVPPLGTSFIAVLSLAWPAIVEQIMITMVQYVDTAMVGTLGSGATAAVGLTASTTWMFNGFLNAAAVGFSVQVAQHIGAGREREARSVTWQALKFVVLFGVLLAVLAAALSFPLPALLGAEEAIRADATVYFCIIGIALPFNFCSVMLSSILRCAGDMRTPMVLNLLINVFNIILNFLLIYPTRPAAVFGVAVTLPGAGLGVAGAALGSAFSMMIVSLLYLLVIFRGRRGPLHISLKERFHFERACLRTALRLGLPVALERTLMSTANIVITGVISSIGTAAVAANHLAVTAESVSYMPAFGVASAGTTLVGQALGAKRKDLALRFSRITTYIGIMIMTLAGAGLFFLAPQLISIFSTDPEVMALGAQVLRIVAFAEPLFAASIVVTGVLRGAGDAKAPFIISLITMWGVRITLSLLLAPQLGLIGVWIAMAVELIVRGMIFMFRLYSNRWLNIQLFSEKKV